MHKEELNFVRNKFNSEINNNNSLVTLRNDYVAHVNLLKTKKSLSPEEVQTHIISMIGCTSSVSSFLRAYTQIGLKIQIK